MRGHAFGCAELRGMQGGPALDVCLAISQDKIKSKKRVHGGSEQVIRTRSMPGVVLVSLDHASV